MFTYLKRVDEKIQGDRIYPYDLYLNMDEMHNFICIGEGSGFGSMGCSMTPDEFISGKWDEYIARFNAFWMRDLIKEIGPAKINQKDIINFWKKNDV